MSLNLLPYLPLLLVIKFIGYPQEYMKISQVCQEWKYVFDEKDINLWQTLSSHECISLQISHNPRTSRSSSNYKLAFLRALRARERHKQEVHNNLIMCVKELFIKHRGDPVHRLEKMIIKHFPTIGIFDVNWKCEMMENNSLITISARYCNPKCVALLVEKFGSKIDLYDVGKFTPLIICAYLGCTRGVKYLIRKGADINARGCLRSGPLLTAEHWAAIEGHLSIFYLLRQHRNNCTSSATISAPVSTSTTVATTTPNGVNDYSAAATSSVPDPQPFDINDNGNNSKESILSLAVKDEELHCTGTASPISSSSSSSSSSFSSSSSSSSSSLPSASSFCIPMISNGIQPQVTTNNHHINNKTTTPIVEHNQQNQEQNDNEESTKQNQSDYCQKPRQERIEVYCICANGYFGHMIACDNPLCPIEWYHYECVGITDDFMPEGTWLCPACRDARFEPPVIKSRLTTIFCHLVDGKEHQSIAPISSSRNKRKKKKKKSIASKSSNHSSNDDTIQINNISTSSGNCNDSSSSAKANSMI